MCLVISRGGGGGGGKYADSSEGELQTIHVFTF